MAEESSARAALILNEHGFSNVTPILGGFNAWVQAGFPVESGK
jgi:rhodanese-related sulfurtransferase